jgi:hypothetical protein
MRRTAGVVALASAIGALWTACGSSPSPASPGNDASASDDGDAQGSGSDAAGDLGSFGDSGPTCMGEHCSSDLHDVLDCKGNVVKACPPDQGCAAGGCVAACDSAIANKSSLGCEYYAFFPYYLENFNGNDTPDCYAAFVANTWTTPVTITADFGGQMLDVTQFARIPSGSGNAIMYGPLPNGKLPADQVAILFLTSTTTGGVACPAPGASAQIANKADLGWPYMTNAAIGKTFHLTTDAPVVVYDIYPYANAGGAVTGASLLLPTSVWDTNYVAVAPWPFGPNNSWPKLGIVALDDGTTVTISPTAPILGGNGIPGTGKGQPQTYNLSKGQLLQFEQQDELTGSPMQSNKPIGVWGLSDTINIDECCADSAHQQLPPVHALGSEYAAVRYRDRVDNKPEAPPWRAIGAVDGTTLTYEPSAPQGAPSTLSLGQVATFPADAPFVVRSQDAQHPFYLSGHMTGGGNDSTDTMDPLSFGGNGDAEFVNVIPPDEYLSSYVLFTDHTYANTSLVVVRVKGQMGAFADVTLDCAGALGGWQPVGSSGVYEETRIDLVKDSMPQGGCDNGRHDIKSDAPFGVTVWGWVNYSSYAYPAGASAAAINTVVVPPLPR